MKTEEALLDFVMSTRYSDLPKEVVTTVKGLIMNILAAVLSGSRIRISRMSTSIIISDKGMLILLF